jgi:hypothetical protein
VDFVTFYATASDLREVLLRVEAQVPMHYARAGAYSTSEPPIHRSAAAIPNLGERGQSPFVEPWFYLLPPGSRPVIRQPKLARGGPWYYVDGRPQSNQSFPTLVHCVLTESGQLEKGYVSNRHDEQPDSLFGAIKEEINRSFVAVGLPPEEDEEPDRVGPDALRQLQAGKIHFAEEGEENKATPLHPCILGRAVYQADRIKPDWKSSEVVRLAEQVSQTKDFTLLPILADALEEAGCTDQDVLDHCRMTGKHFARCWVVNLLGERKQPKKGGRKKKKE